MTSKCTQLLFLTDRDIVYTFEYLIGSHTNFKRSNSWSRYRSGWKQSWIYWQNFMSCWQLWPHIFLLNFLNA